MGKRELIAIAGSLLLAGSLAACSNSTESQAEAESAVCTSLAQVKTAAADVKALNSTSTVSDAKSATAALEKALEEFKKSAQDVSEADKAALESATKQISQAVNGVTGGDTLSEAAGSVQGSSASLDAAVTQIQNGVQCK